MGHILDTDGARAMAFILAGGIGMGLYIVYAWAFWALIAGVSTQHIFQPVAMGLQYNHRGFACDLKLIRRIRWNSIVETY
jgi:hypothetical protein